MPCESAQRGQGRVGRAWVPLVFSKIRLGEKLVVWHGAVLVLVVGWLGDKKVNVPNVKGWLEMI